MTTAEPVAVDTSVAVALLMRSHPAHLAVRSALDGRSCVLTGHSLAETYAVLTRLPGDARVAPDDACELIDRAFGECAALPETVAVGVHRVLSELGISGGAVYDGLVALAALHNDLTLATRDARASATYLRVGCRTELMR